MTDVALLHENDGGNIEVERGRFSTANGLFNAVYLSLFGGNERDSGDSVDDPLEWWGNKIEPVASRRYRSETQALLKDLPLVPSTRRRFEDAATRDLAWLTEDGRADFVAVTCSIPGLNRLAFSIKIEVDDELYAFSLSHGAQ